MDLLPADLFTVGITAAVCSILVIGLIRFLGVGPSALRNPIGGAELCFLIQDDILLDATPAAYALLSGLKTNTNDRAAVIDALIATFPSVRDALTDSAIPDTIIDAVDDTGKYLRIRSKGKATSLSVHGPQERDLMYLHQLRTANNTAELMTLRTAIDHNRQLMWETDGAGNLVWANPAYMEVADRLSPTPEHDNVRLFPNSRPFAEFEAGANKLSTSRVAIPSTNPNEEDWFDVEVTKTPTGSLYYAKDINDIIRSEISQQSFLKTISQTFAQLSIGLAIFDRGRRLSTFNPALIDLTSLPVDFLTGRPSLDMVLDRLRETRMLPEPKDYAQWRDGFARLETEARNGTYSENWNLPDGQTYRVTGRPHPDGAFALLFEDISAEISLTRRFRSEIETGQAVLDRIPDAIVVFSSAGNLVMSNQPYEDLWEAGSCTGLIQSDLRSEINSWKARCAPTRMWQGLRGFVHQTGSRDPWVETMLLDDGRPIRCRAEAITGGMTMVRFTLDSEVTGALRAVTDENTTLAHING